MSEQQARTAIGDAGLTVGTIDTAYDANVAPNHVISQDPAADTYVDKQTSVDITVSRGAHPTKVPYLLGQTRAQAQTALDDAHLKAVFKPVKSDQTKGTVVSTNPTAGAQVARDSEVIVEISKGPQKIPNVVGLQQAQAEQTLRDAGFVPVPVTSSTSDAPAGQVIQQVPGANQPAQQGTQVTIVVSSGPSSPATSSTPASPSSPTSSGASSAPSKGPQP